MTGSSPPRALATSSSSGGRISINTSTGVQDAAPRQRAPRSLPPWIDSYEERYGPATREQLKLLQPPARSARPHHNATPAEPERRVSKDGFIDWDDPSLGPGKASRAKIPHFLRYGRASARGRKWDHLRSADPVIVPGYVPTRAYGQTSTGWNDFIHASAYGPMPNEESEVVDPGMLEKLQPGFGGPARGPYDPLDTTRSPPRSRRNESRAVTKRLWRFVMQHTLSPLVFRLTVMVTSLLALGVAAKIYELENSLDNDSAERTQSIVAIVVDSVAIPYIGYMIWDEYTGKPVGLRSGVSKMSLILLDLFFIIFKSASTALAFESLAYHNVKESDVRELAKVLAAFMLVGLISWTMNLTVNIFRTVERLGGGEDDSPHR